MSKTRGLKTLADLPELPAGRNPTSRIVVARLGAYTDSRYGAFKITAADYEGWQRNLSDTMGGRASIDYDHSSERGKGTLAAGWIVGLERQGKDVLADVEWTPKGAAAIRDGDYKFISPSFGPLVDEFGVRHDRVLHGAALTNKPVLRRGMPTLSLSRDASKELKKMQKKAQKKQLAKAERKRAKQLDRRASKKLRKTIRALSQPSAGVSPAPLWGDPTAVQATGAGRVPPGLDDSGLVLHSSIAAKAAREGKHYFRAMSDLTGNQSYAKLSDIPPAVIPDEAGPMTGIDHEQAALYLAARTMAVALGISWNDACEILYQQRELAKLQEDDGSAPVDWLDSTERPSPPRPYGAGAAEDWERDQRRAAAGGVEIDHAAWKAGAELGVDAVGQLADAHRADRVAALKERSAGALENAQRREDERRTSALQDELTSRAKQRTAAAQRAAAAPSWHGSYNGHQ